MKQKWYFSVYFIENERIYLWLSIFVIRDTLIKDKILIYMQRQFSNIIHLLKDKNSNFKYKPKRMRKYFGM